MKNLYRSRDNKVFAGIFGGLGEYFDLDPTLLRLLWLFVLVITAFVPGIIAYIIAMFVVPKKPESERKKENK
ncbi:MAG: PspC domain-containing protein [Candidatus Pacebacteria bacterium]|nr:PspC domain-containing protein [Candidatus Paceibacterota bacterium]